MNYFQSTTDASRLYRPTTAMESDQHIGTEVRGNLADQMNNTMIIRTTSTMIADSNYVIMREK